MPRAFHRQWRPGWRTDPVDWARDRHIWPNADASRFIEVRPHRWHVQIKGDGPDVLLLHGAGGATQSWRKLFPLLAENYRVIAPDLPGQGFTSLGARSRCSLPLMAEDMARLCAQEEYHPVAIVGHSAGAALALQLARTLDVPKTVGINAALDNFEGIAGWLFPVMAKVMAANPMIPPLLARLAGGPARARELLASTGSNIDDEGVALYHRLMRDSAHIDGVLAMMAKWDVADLVAHISEIDTDCLLLTGSADRTVSPDVSDRAARRMRHAQHIRLPNLGHLAHEEDAETVARAIEGFLGATSLSPAAE